ncbi:recombinase family protein, partial [Azospirillum rugosum]
MALIGYARVSTEDQATFSQLDELRAAGCAVIFEETASGGSRARPELAKAIAQVKRGDILVVARIDRLARSLSHLLDVIERLEAVGAHFKSLRDPIDTATPQGKFALQVLGAAAELERALIRERTKAGLRAAKARGRVGGNPALKRRDPGAIAQLSAIRDRRYMADLLATMDAWMPKVRAQRPGNSWATVARALGRLGSPDRPWTADRL